MNAQGLDEYCTRKNGDDGEGMMMVEGWRGRKDDGDGRMVKGVKRGEKFELTSNEMTSTYVCDVARSEGQSHSKTHALISRALASWCSTAPHVLRQDRKMSLSPHH